MNPRAIFVSVATRPVPRAYRRFLTTWNSVAAPWSPPANVVSALLGPPLQQFLVGKLPASKLQRP